MASIGTGWVDGAWIEAAWVTGAWSNVASATITGTAITGGVTESEIIAGEETIVITLTADTWVAAGATFNAQRQAIIDGLDSDGLEAAGWNAEVRDKEVVTAVVRTSDTVVTVTLTASPDYEVDSDETITVTVPAAALTAGSPLTATPTFDITAEAEAEEAAAGGSWLSPAQVRNLRNLARTADRTRQARWERRQEKQAERLDELRAVYDRVQGNIVASPEAQDIAEAVIDFTGIDKSAPIRHIPQIAEVDFTGLEASAQAVSRLAKALTKMARVRNEEQEAVILLMMAA